MNKILQSLKSPGYSNKRNTFYQILNLIFKYCLKLKGIKISSKHFQYAAWAFQRLRDVYSPHDFTSDLNEDIMTFKMNLMLVNIFLLNINFLICIK